MLLGETLKEPFDSYSDLLPNNSAWATRIPYKNKEKEAPKAKKVKKEPIEPVNEPTKKVKKETMIVKKNKKPVME